MCEASPRFFRLCRRFVADFPSQRLLRLSSEGSQTVRGYSSQTLLTLGRDQAGLSLRSLTRNVLRGFASLLHHRCLYERQSGDEREMNAGKERGRRGRKTGKDGQIGEKQADNFLKFGIGKVFQRIQLVCVLKNLFWTTFLEDEKFKTQQISMLLFRFGQLLKFFEKKVFKIRQLFCKNVWRFHSKFISLHRFSR